MKAEQLQAAAGTLHAVRRIERLLRQYSVHWMVSIAYPHSNLLATIQQLDDRIASNALPFMRIARPFG